MSRARLADCLPVSQQWSKHADCHLRILYSSSIADGQDAKGCEPANKGRKLFTLTKILLRQNDISIAPGLQEPRFPVALFL
jgi:hypothetical protein